MRVGKTFLPKWTEVKVTEIAYTTNTHWYFSSCANKYMYILQKTENEVTGVVINMENRTIFQPLFKRPFTLLCISWPRNTVFSLITL